MPEGRMCHRATGDPGRMLRGMMGDFQPMLQLGLLAVAMLLAGLATLLQRRPEPVLDWPPSPPPPKHVRRDLIVVSSALMFFIVGVAVGAAAVATAVLQVMATNGGLDAG